MKLRSLTRWQAAGAHLVLSALIAVTLVVLVVAIWYPGPYFAAMGGATLLRLLIGIDVVLGPLITLIIFDVKKPRLGVDLSIVAGLQFVALLYGAWIMFDARPVYAVFTGDRFEVVPANSIDDPSRARAAPEFRDLPLGGPQVVGAHQPTDQRERADIALSSMSGGPDIANLPHLYHAYAQVTTDAGRRAMPLTQLSRRGAVEERLVREYLEGSGRAESTLGFLPVRARNKDFAFIIDRGSGEIVGSLPINPW